ncbi:hypothetical protein JTE90_001337 [Oedothorax gibbosus]|uniref:Uncharacterized protein n=1 Tax=Oedothorax gibbosus TaxID=931172 RepID=A0AAV6V2D2_9ARAC|nr:hypothetical protein JTE90_001337 [Oedothorax gibbosus]
MNLLIRDGFSPGLPARVANFLEKHHPNPEVTPNTKSITPLHFALVPHAHVVRKTGGTGLHSVPVAVWKPYPMLTLNPPNPEEISRGLVDRVFKLTTPLTVPFIVSVLYGAGENTWSTESNVGVLCQKGSELGGCVSSGRPGVQVINTDSSRFWVPSGPSIDFQMRNGGRKRNKIQEEKRIKNGGEEDFYPVKESERRKKDYPV